MEDPSDRLKAAWTLEGGMDGGWRVEGVGGGAAEVKFDKCTV